MASAEKKTFPAVHGSHATVGASARHAVLRVIFWVFRVLRQIFIFSWCGCSSARPPSLGGARGDSRPCTSLPCASLVGKILSHGCHRTGTWAVNARIRSTLPQLQTGRPLSSSRFLCNANMGANPWSMHAPVAAKTRVWVWDRHVRLQLASICCLTAQTTSVQHAGKQGMFAACDWQRYNGRA